MLVLDTQEVTDIWQGTTKKWDASRITLMNQYLAANGALPTENIVLVGAFSDTTESFSDIFAAVGISTPTQTVFSSARSLSHAEAIVRSVPYATTLWPKVRPTLIRESKVRNSRGNDIEATLEAIRACEAGDANTCFPMTSDFALLVRRLNVEKEQATAEGHLCDQMRTLAQFSKWVVSNDAKGVVGQHYMVAKASAVGNVDRDLSVVLCNASPITGIVDVDTVYDNALISIGLSVMFVTIVVALAARTCLM